MKIEMNRLRGDELFKFEELIGKNMQDIDEASQVKVMYALAFLAKRREKASTKWTEVTDLTLEEVQEYLGVNDDESDDAEGKG